jgi:catechol 2,3-dioxygenase-like lactoylglutathione lyase family enzyme
MSHLELVTLVVRDYDAAIRFFVDVLQFALVEDTPSLTNDGRPKRWVVVLCEQNPGLRSTRAMRTVRRRRPRWAGSSPAVSGCSCASRISTPRISA